MGKIPGLSYGKTPFVPEQGGQVSPGSDNTGAALANLGDKVTALGSGLLDIYQDTQADKEASLAQQELQEVTVRLKQNQDMEGNQITPDKHEEVFGREVERIKERAGNNLRGKAIRKFDSVFNDYSNRATLQVKTHALDLYQSEISANTDISLRADATAFVNEGPIGKATIKKKAFDAIDDRVARGVWTPEQGLSRKFKFIDDSAKGSFDKLLNESDEGPRVALRSLDAGEFGDDLPADTIEALRHKAYERIWQNTQRKIAEENHRYTIQERREKEADQAASNDLFKAYTEKKLTPDMVTERLSDLSVSSQKAFWKMANGQGDDVVTNWAVANDLKARALSGQDVRAEAMEAVGQNQISGEFSSKLVDIINDHSPALKANNTYNMGRSYIENMFKEKIDKGIPGASLRYVETLEEWMKWSNDPANKKLPRERHEKEYRDLVRSSQILQYGEMSMNRPLPRGIQTRDELDVSSASSTKATKEKIVAAQKANEKLLKSKQITPYEFAREEALLGKYLLGLPVWPDEPKAGAKQ